MQVDDVVEDFTLQNQDGKTVHLSDYKKSPVVLFFYPRADTPGCTIESCGFRDAFREVPEGGDRGAGDLARHGEGPEEVQGQV